MWSCTSLSSIVPPAVGCASSIAVRRCNDSFAPQRRIRNTVWCHVPRTRPVRVGWWLVDETPGGPPDDPKPHDEEQLPQEPHPHEGLPFGEEGHEPAGGEHEDRAFGGDDEPGEEHGGDSLPPRTEDQEGEEDGEGGPVHAGSEGPLPAGFEDDDDDEHHTVEETELAGGLGEDTELHLIDDEAEVEYDYHSFDDADYESLEEEIHSADELRQRRLEERAARRRAGRQRLLALLLGVGVIVI